MWRPYAVATSASSRHRCRRESPLPFRAALARITESEAGHCRCEEPSDKARPDGRISSIIGGSKRPLSPTRAERELRAEFKIAVFGANRARAVGVDWADGADFADWADGQRDEIIESLPIRMGVVH